MKPFAPSGGDCVPALRGDGVSTKRFAAAYRYTVAAWISIVGSGFLMSGDENDERAENSARPLSRPPVPLPGGAGRTHTL